MNTNERRSWLESRQLGVGSSDAPSLVGVGFNSAAKVYLDKVNPIAEEKPNGFMRRGIACEPLVAVEYCTLMDVVLIQGCLVAHPDRPWQLATPDYSCLGTERLVECKAISTFGDLWGPSGSDQIPPGYYVQCQHQMGVRGQHSMDLAALAVVTWELRIYPIMFDAEFFAWLTAIELDFWGHVLARTPISAEWENRFATEAEERLVFPGTQLLPASAGVLCEQRLDLLAIRKQADAEYQRVGGELVSLLGGNEVGILPGWRVKQSKTSNRLSVRKQRIPERLLMTQTECEEEESRINDGPDGQFLQAFDTIHGEASE